MDYASSTAELSTLLKTGRPHTLIRGQLLGGVGDNIGAAIVERGYIKRYLITPDGNQSILIIYGPGHIFPFTPIYRELTELELYEGDQVFYYEAMSNAKIRTITMASLGAYCQDNPHIYKELFYIAGTRLNLVIASSEIMSLGNSYMKLAQQLVYFGNHFGEVSANGEVKILLPLTNSDLAGLLNLTRETISRSMSRLKRKGLVRPGINLVITDIDKLRREAY